MIQFPPVKINLGLQVIRKRKDGFHDIQSVFFPLPIHDILEIIPDPSGESVQFSISGIPVPGNMDDNICVKAWQLLKKDFPSLVPVKMHLHKMIPPGAGLGAGSADGAYALRMLNTICGLNLDTEQLTSYAAALGSDCPFFIYNAPCYVTGRGENLEPVAVDLAGKYMVVINPGIHISTREAFAGIKPAEQIVSPATIIQSDLSTWKDNLTNDFEDSVFPNHPAIASLKTLLYKEGAVYASMSGSGSTVYGIFNDEPPALHFPDTYFARSVKCS